PWLRITRDRTASFIHRLGITARGRSGTSHRPCLPHIEHFQCTGSVCVLSSTGLLTLFSLRVCLVAFEPGHYLLFGHFEAHCEYLDHLVAVSRWVLPQKALNGLYRPIDISFVR